MKSYLSLTIALLAIKTDLFAAEAGMPQLDPTYWASQAFWLILIFTVLYISIAKFYLPKIKNNLDDRENKIKEEPVSVIQFSATWCGPCKTLKPVMDKLSDEYKDRANFYITDIEDSGINTGSSAGIRGVPTVIVYKKGVEIDRKVGGVPESHMKEFLDKNI